MGIKEEGGGSAGRAQTLNVVKQRDMTNRGRGGILLFLPLFFASFKREMRRVYPRARVSVRVCESTNETGEDFCQSSSRSIRSNIKRRWWEE